MVRIRRIDATHSDEDLIINIGRNRTVAELREEINNARNIPIKNQKLYFQGKELVDEHQLFDYGIKQHHIIHLYIRSKESNEFIKINLKDTLNNGDGDNKIKETLVIGESKYFKVGDLVDVRLLEWNNAWFEAEIEQIFHNEQIPVSASEDHLVFSCKICKYSYMKSFRVFFNNMRPSPFHSYKITDITSGMKILANVNVDEPKKRGLWYEFEVKDVSSVIQGIALMGVPIECTVYFIDELLRLEEPTLLSERIDSIERIQREYPEDCTACHDNMRRNCKQCGCHTCGKKDCLDSILLCDECDFGYHMKCLKPPLDKIPDGDWFCPTCKNDENEIVNAGERLTIRRKAPKKILKKDWDNGMACAGRSKECTIVPKNHFGPVPGVDVGTLWKFRTQVSEAGIHRPIVAGIHGRSDEGAYSIVLSGGYEDDCDKGYEFEYTGAGGRDLSGNKRVSGQTRDQLLTQSNKALAMCCNAKFNNVSGAKAKDWKAGKPVRVVRKHGKSEFAPDDGYRYDGIYKVIKYYRHKGLSGFFVWKFSLRRDDPSPAPWTKDAPFYEMIYPPDHFELEAAKKKKCIDKIPKRKQTEECQQGDCKKLKTATNYCLPSKLDDKIKSDISNMKHWKECRDALIGGEKLKFLNKITEVFECICCRELVNEPVTLPCSHNVCKSCLQRSFEAGFTICPNCRRDLGQNYQLDVNLNFYEILKELFPGYENGR